MVMCLVQVPGWSVSVLADMDHVGATVVAEV